MVKLQKIEKVQTIEQLNALGLGLVDYNVSHRGGGVGFNSAKIAVALDLDINHLPRKFGVYCNYLGGGIRGAITGSRFSPSITGKKAELLTALSEACKRVYLNIENGAGLNDEEDQDGETNWDAIASNHARKAKIVSAY